MTTQFDLNAAVDGAIKLARSQNKNLQEKVSCIVQEILTADSPSETAKTVFLQARGPYVLAKTKKDKSTATEYGAAWNRLKSAMEYHFNAAEMSIKWPNWATGLGDITITDTKTARLESKKLAEDKKIADAEAMQQLEQDQALSRLAALRVMGPDDLACQIMETIFAWGGDPSQVLALLSDRIAKTETA